MFVAGLISVLWGIKRIFGIVKADNDTTKSILEKPIAYGVGGITMLWTLERIFVFWV